MHRILWIVFLGLMFHASIVAQDNPHVTLDEPAFSSILAKQIFHAVQECIAATREQRAPRLSSLSPTLQRANNGVHLRLYAGGKLLGEGRGGHTNLAGNLRVACAQAASALTGKQSPCDLLLTISLPPQPLRDVRAVPMSLRLAFTLGHDAIRLGETDAGYRGALIPLLGHEDWWEYLEKTGRQLTHSDDKKAVLDVLTKTDVITRYPTVTFLLRAGEKTPVRLSRMTSVVPVTSITQASVIAALARAGAWFQRNQEENGAFPAEVLPYSATVRNDAPADTCAGAAYAMGELWRHTRADGIRLAGKKSLTHLFTQTLETSPDKVFKYLRDKREIPLDASALSLRALLGLQKRDIDPGDKVIADHLAAFCLAMRRPDGGWAVRFPPEDTARSGVVAPSLAQLALLDWGRQTSNTPTLQMLRSLGGPIALQFRKERATASVAYQTELLVRLHEMESMPRALTTVFEMNDYLVTLQEIHATAFTGPMLPDSQGRFRQPGRVQKTWPDVAATGLYVQGLTHAMRLAERAGDAPRRRRYLDAILWATRFLLQCQFREDADFVAVPQPDLVRGGFRVRPDLAVIRLETMQHATLGLLRVLQTLTPKDYARVEELSTFRH